MLRKAFVGEHPHQVFVLGQETQDIDFLFDDLLLVLVSAVGDDLDCQMFVGMFDINCLFDFPESTLAQ